MSSRIVICIGLRRKMPIHYCKIAVKNMEEGLYG